MKEHFIKLPVDGPPEWITIDTSSTDSLLEGMYREIGCNCIETISFLYSTDYRMIVDESGKLKPHLINKVATYFYTGDYIAGTALICKTGYRNGEQDLIGLNKNNINDNFIFEKMTLIYKKSTNKRSKNHD